MIPPLAGGWGSEDEVDSSTAKPVNGAPRPGSASFLKSTAEPASLRKAYLICCARVRFQIVAKEWVMA